MRLTRKRTWNDVPKGQNMNSRGRKPTVRRNIYSTPQGSHFNEHLDRGLTPTAIHIWPLRGPKDEVCAESIPRNLLEPRFKLQAEIFAFDGRYKWPCAVNAKRAQMTSHHVIKKFKRPLVLFARILLGALLAVVGTVAYFYFCGYQLHKQCPLIGLPRNIFLAGAKARLDRNINYAQLQSWAAGVTPNGPQKEGEPIHLPNGQTITPTDWRGDGFVNGEDGSFQLLTNHLPPMLSALLPEPPLIIVHGNADPARRRVNVGYPDRFGLNLTIGPTNYVYEGLPGLMCTNGIYVYVGGGG